MDFAKTRVPNLVNYKSQTLTAKEKVFASTEDKQPWRATPILYEWWDTPNKFKRRKLDDMECDIINVSSYLYLETQLINRK